MNGTLLDFYVVNLFKFEYNRGWRNLKGKRSLCRVLDVIDGE